MSINFGRLLDKAERDYLLYGQSEFRFSLRFPAGSRREEVERQLEGQSEFRVIGHRDVKEGMVWVGWPSELSLSLDGLLSLRPQLRAVRSNWEEARRIGADLLPWEEFLQSNFSECSKKAEMLPALAKVLKYLFDNRDSVRGLYPRQVPHGQSTKIIGYEPLLLRLYSATRSETRDLGWDAFFEDFALKRRSVGFEFFSDEIAWDGRVIQNIHAVLSDENADRWDIRSARRILIVENEEVFFPLREAIDKCVLILGAGKKAAALGFLAKHIGERTDVFYWGDIDKEGYEILANVVSELPRAKPLLMDQRTIERYWTIRQPCEPTTAGQRPQQTLPSEYRRVCLEGFGIEQEQIALNDLFEALG